MKIDRQLFRQSDFIETAISNVSSALRDGAILVAIILSLFLFNFRTTLISLAALLLAIKAAGATINTMTLTTSTCRSTRARRSKRPSTGALSRGFRRSL